MTVAVSSSANENMAVDVFRSESAIQNPNTDMTSRSDVMYMMAAICFEKDFHIGSGSVPHWQW